MHDHMRNVPLFSGTPPVAVLRWLASITSTMDNVQVPEAAAWRLAPQYLTDEAKDSYESNMESGYSDHGGFNSWPAAVNWLLSTYVTNTALNAAI